MGVPRQQIGASGNGPVYLRAENRTRGHALVVMLAYLMAQELDSAGATAT